MINSKPTWSSGPGVVSDRQRAQGYETLADPEDTGRLQMPIIVALVEAFRCLDVLRKDGRVADVASGVTPRPFARGDVQGHHEGMVTPGRCRRVVVLGLVTLCLVGLAVGMLTALQRQLIYFPDSTTVPPAGEVIEGARDITLRTSDGLALGAWFVPPNSASDMGMAVLAAPGNGGNRLGRVGLAGRVGRLG